MSPPGSFSGRYEVTAASPANRLSFLLPNMPPSFVQWSESTVTTGTSKPLQQTASTPPTAAAYTPGVAYFPRDAPACFDPGTSTTTRLILPSHDSTTLSTSDIIERTRKYDGQLDGREIRPQVSGSGLPSAGQTAQPIALLEGSKERTGKSIMARKPQFFTQLLNRFLVDGDVLCKLVNDPFI